MQTLKDIGKILGQAALAGGAFYAWLLAANWLHLRGGTEAVVGWFVGSVVATLGIGIYLDRQ